MPLTPDQIVNANKAGLKHRGSETIWSYWTPVLQVAYNLGWDGVELTNQVVSGWRYGAAPAMGISHNFADDTSEKGLALAALDGHVEVGSTIWFSDRKKHSYSGILVPVKGSDGETLILPLHVDNLDD
jgi:hypothetical protein